jgi:hypothetical protein
MRLSRNKIKKILKGKNQSLLKLRPMKGKKPKLYITKNRGRGVNLRTKTLKRRKKKFLKGGTRTPVITPEDAVASSSTATTMQQPPQQQLSPPPPPPPQNEGTRKETRGLGIEFLAANQNLVNGFKNLKDIGIKIGFDEHMVPFISNSQQTTKGYFDVVAKWLNAEPGKILMEEILQILKKLKYNMQIMKPTEAAEAAAEATSARAAAAAVAARAAAAAEDVVTKNAAAEAAAAEAAAAAEPALEAARAEATRTAAAAAAAAQENAEAAAAAAETEAASAAAAESDRVKKQAAWDNILLLITQFIVKSRGVIKPTPSDAADGVVDPAAAAVTQENAKRE